MSAREEIRREAVERGIKSLVHFTPLGNARNILTYGLAPRPELDKHGIAYIPTDGWRGDNQPDALSLSIGEINYSMYHSKRDHYRSGWVIFAVDPSVLWTHNCRFCWTNAASLAVRDHYRRLDGPWGFRRMFEGKPVSGRDLRCQRDVNNLHRSIPTDNAAEVQVFDPIAPELIIAVGIQFGPHRYNLERLMAEIGNTVPIEDASDIIPP